MIFGEKIFDYKEEIIRDLNELISIQSVSSTNAEEAEKALDFILSRAKEMGFETKKIGKVAGHAQFGEGQELAAVLAHVDVVPAGEGWSVPPFELTETNGRLYGRGVVDDKGPAIVALYCLKALKDSGIEPKRRIRVIFGAEEEIGMNDMETYFAAEELPDMAFTPDSEYGICLKEKGIMQLEVSAPNHDGTILTEFQSGGAVNAVPSKAYALVDCTESEDNQLRRFADAKPGEYDFIYTMDGLHISAKGKAAHASTPEKGLNPGLAIARIIERMHKLNNYSGSSLRLSTLICCRIGTEAYGTSPGMGEVMFTLRTDSNDKMTELMSAADGIALEEARNAGLELEKQVKEPFRATENSPAIVEQLNSIFSTTNNVVMMDKCFRWSEDFAEYLKVFPGAFFGLGSGENQPELHNPYYDFPDDIIDLGANCFHNILDNIKID